MDVAYRPIRIMEIIQNFQGESFLNQVRIKLPKFSLGVKFYYLSFFYWFNERSKFAIF